MRLEGQSDAKLKGVSAKIEKGDLDGAKADLSLFAANSRNVIEKVALANYAFAQIAEAQQRLDEAEDRAATAVSLSPTNCTYRAKLAFLRFARGRLSDAELILKSPAYLRCFQDGSVADIARLSLIQAQLSIERSDEHKARLMMDRAYASITALLDGLIQQRSAALESACTFYDLTHHWPERGRQQWPSAQSHCLAAATSWGRQSKDAPATDNNVMAARAAYYLSPREDAALRIARGREIVARWKSFDDALVPGVDLLERRRLWAMLRSDLGFDLMWRADAPEEAAKEYAAAFLAIEPLLESGRPSVLFSLGFLLLRIVSLENVSVARVFPDSADRLLDALVRAQEADRSMGSAANPLVYRHLRSVAASIRSPRSSDLVAVFERRFEDRIEALPSWSWWARKLRLEALEQVEGPSVERLNERIDAREKLFGFPQIDGIHTDQARDLIARAFARAMIDSRLPSESESDFERALNESLIDIETIQGRSTAVFALRFWPAEERRHQHDVVAIAIKIVDAQQIRGNVGDAPPSSACLAQLTRVLGLSTYLTAAVRANRMQSDALERYRVERDKGNLCSNIPVSRNWTGREYEADVAAGFRDSLLTARFIEQGRTPPTLAGVADELVQLDAECLTSFQLSQPRACIFARPEWLKQLTRERRLPPQS